MYQKQSLRSSGGLLAKPPGFTDMFLNFTSSLSTIKMILHLQRFRRTHNHVPKHVKSQRGMRLSHFYVFHMPKPDFCIFNVVCPVWKNKKKDNHQYKSQLQSVFISLSQSQLIKWFRFSFSQPKLGSTVGERRIRKCAYFYRRTHDFGHDFRNAYVDTYAHFFSCDFLVF